MNWLQWFAAFCIGSLSYAIGWLRGYAIAKREWFVRGKIAGGR